MRTATTGSPRCERATHTAGQARLRGHPAHVTRLSERMVDDAIPAAKCADARPCHPRRSRTARQLLARVAALDGAASGAAVAAENVAVIALLTGVMHLIRVRVRVIVRVRVRVSARTLTTRTRTPKDELTIRDLRSSVSAASAGPGIADAHTPSTS